jgi:hypothetical protein
MRDRKSPAHARIMSYSPNCAEIEGLDGGGVEFELSGDFLNGQ